MNTVQKTIYHASTDLHQLNRFKPIVHNNTLGGSSDIFENLNWFRGSGEARV